MNAMMSSMRRHQITKVILSLLIVALIAGLTGCVGEASRTVKYDLTIASGLGGSVTVPGEGTFRSDSGRVVELLAISTSGYRFVNWTGNVDTIANPNAASTTITMNDDYSIRANFEETEPTFYTLTVGVTGSGSTSPATGSHTYSAGTVVTIIATATSGYRFVNWTGDVATIGDPDSARTTITIYGSYSITANFEEGAATYYTLTMAVIGSGSTSPAVGQHTYTAGTSVPISATAAGGYHFSHWTAAPAVVFDNANAAQTTFIMPAAAVTITAHFQDFPPVPPGQYTLTMTVTGSGSTSPAVGQHTYTAGTSVPIAATAAAGYHFSHWTAAPAVVFSDAYAAQTTFTMPAAAVTITAHFQEFPPVPPGQYTLTMAVTGSGSTSPAVGQHTYTAGTLVTIQASAASGYHFSHWTAAPAVVFDNAYAAQTTFTMPAAAVTITAHFERIDFMVSAGDLHTVGVKSNGTVLAVGDNEHGQCNVGSWTNFIQVAAGGFHTVGVKSDGAVIATGNNRYGQCNVSSWTNIIQVAAGDYHTVGLRSDGTVVAAGYNYHGQCDVGAWTNIVQVAAGGYYTVGLESDGTVIATGNNWYGQCDVSSWTNIIQVAAGHTHTVGLKPDGTAVAAGYNYHGQCNVSGWTGIIQVTAGWQHTVGLKSGGNAVAVGGNYHGQCNVSGWTGIIQISAGWQRSVGLKPDGTVVAGGWNEYGQCDVTDWDLN